MLQYALALLLLLVKDTKFESKSQQLAFQPGTSYYCFYWSKIQNLKANHNVNNGWRLSVKIAFTGQRYKIWKQITTLASTSELWVVLLLLVKDTKFESKSQRAGSSFVGSLDSFYWSKIQNLKANHNNITDHIITFSIAFTGQRYKIWKQITTFPLTCHWTLVLLLLVKDTKFESKSQRVTCYFHASTHCFYWSKIQNLKANHN